MYTPVTSSPMYLHSCRQECLDFTPKRHWSPQQFPSTSPSCIIHTPHPPPTRVRNSPIHLRTLHPAAIFHYSIFSLHFVGFIYPSPTDHYFLHVYSGIKPYHDAYGYINAPYNYQVRQCPNTRWTFDCIQQYVVVVDAPSAGLAILID